MSTEAASSGISELERFLVKNGIPQPVATFVTTPKEADPPGRGLESIADFAAVFTERDYEDRMQTFILDQVAAHKEDYRALGRLRTAWLLAKSDVTKACKALAEGAITSDWDQPLGVEDEATRKDEFNGAYDGLAYSSEDTPLATITGRYFREFRSPLRHITLTNLA